MEMKLQISDEFKLNETGEIVGSVECVIIQSFGGKYDDTIKAIPMEMPSQDSAYDTTYTTSHKREDMEVIECYIKNDINMELSSTFFDAPYAQKSKEFYLECIEADFKECSKSGGMH